jgi:prepilin-type N-terminal cleavage/methylation domain-containing protein
MKSKNRAAFSLIELSIVILVIGVLIAGVLQGSKMLTRFKLQTAQNLTTNSPAAGIKDLMLWYETSLASSFQSTEAVNATAVSAWYDNNPQSVTKNNATQSTTSQKPKFYENVFNGAIPAIRFDGSNDSMPFDGSPLIGANYTIFVVEQRRGVPAASISSFLAGNAGGSLTNLHIGYGGSTTVKQDHSSSGASYTIATYSEPIPRIHTFWFSTSSGYKYWLNGGVTPYGSSGRYGALVSYANSAVGGASAVFYYLGDLAEIIIYTRSLTTEERQAIESYLGKKFVITLSS